VVWLTGLPGSGKTTLAKTLEPRLIDNGRRVEVLDGDEVRGWLSPGEGFSREDRERHLRRVAHICHLLARNGVAVLAAFVSPYRSTREYARGLITDFVEVYVKCSLETCVKRDPKGLYKNAREGKITLLTGLQDPYEEPTNPAIIIDTEAETPTESAGEILTVLTRRGYLSDSPVSTGMTPTATTPFASAEADRRQLPSQPRLGTQEYHRPTKAEAQDQDGPLGKGRPPSP